MPSAQILNFPLRDEFRGYGASDWVEVWDIAKPLVQKALDRDPEELYSIEDVEAMLWDAKAQLWMWGHKAALITSVQRKGGKTYCLLLALGGKAMSEWLDHLPVIEEFARMNDCDELRIYGRIGWARVLGWHVDYARMHKSLCPPDPAT